uniref:Putative ovule protein n=1 Tax=Solanum chacoense TaxID=4108 RepID=A0A0V0H2I5_SOLCH
MIKYQWNLISVIESIKDKLKVFEYVQLQFYFREANSVMDSLTNEGLKLEGQIWYDEFEQLSEK